MRMSEHPESLPVIAKKMKEYRESMGLTQADVEKATGLQRTYISAVERGRILVIYPEPFALLHRLYRFPAYEMLEAMGYPTDSSEGNVNDALLMHLKGLSAVQQRAVLDIVRSMSRAADTLGVPA